MQFARAFIACAVLATCQRPLLAQSPPRVSFAPAMTFAAPAPVSIAAGDINNDGIPDIAVVTDQASGVSSALGKGDGTFGSWALSYAGPAPHFITLADVNQDGNLDTLASDAQTNYVFIGYGDGKGGFTAGSKLAGGKFADPWQTVVTDLNGDGIPDIIGTEFCAGGVPGHLFVYLGRGKGKFAPMQTVGTGGQCPNGFAVGDFNNDGIPDVVVANGPNGNGLGVAILLGKGDGTFKTPTRYPSGREPELVAVGDFNRDGNLDVAEASSSAYSIHLFDGNGDGTLTPQPLIPYSVQTVWFAVADFNGDGKLDIARAKGGFVAILLGNGDGTFQPNGQMFRVGHLPVQLVVADFNTDGRPDIAVVDNSLSTVSILLNTTKFPNK